MYSLDFASQRSFGLRPQEPARLRLTPLLTRPPKGACPFATWQAVRGRAPLTTSPERWGRSRASRSGPLRGRCANLDPLPLRRPAVALWRVSSGRRVKGLVRPAAPQGRGLGPLTRLERPQPHVSGGRGRSSPCPPSPRRQEWGVQRGKAPMGKGVARCKSKKASAQRAGISVRPKAALALAVRVKKGNRYRPRNTGGVFSG